MVREGYKGFVADCTRVHLFTEEPLHPKELSACASGKGHLSYALSGYRGKQRFAIYVPDELAPEVQKAIENGRQLQELMKEAGLRYVKARKQERKWRKKE